ncbi:MAG: LysM peptidoglycan-binding domain-containing protein [Desulfosalsimonadaceae bacterium]
MERENEDRYEDEEESPRSLLSNSGGLWQTASRKQLILGGVAALLVILLMTVVFSRDDDKAVESQVQSPSYDAVERLNARFERLEERIDAVEIQLTRLPALIHQVETMETGGSTGQADQVLARMERLDTRIKDIQEETRELKSRQESLSKELSQKQAAPAPSPKSTAGSGETRYHEVRKGDTLYSIARANGISLQALLEQNNLRRDAVIQPGDRLVIRK